jgi:hypothetical protein
VQVFFFHILHTPNSRESQPNPQTLPDSILIARSRPTDLTMENISYQSPRETLSPATPSVIGFVSIAVVATLGGIGLFVAAGWWFKFKRALQFATVVLPVNEYPSGSTERWSWTFGVRNSVSTAGSQAPLPVNLDLPGRAHRAPERRSVRGTLLRLSPTASYPDDRLVHVPDSLVSRGETSQQRRSRAISLQGIRVTRDVSVHIDHFAIEVQQGQDARDSVSTLPRYSTPPLDTPPPVYQVEKDEIEMDEFVSNVKTHTRRRSV